MSPTEPPAPERAGSVRHSACLWPVVSILVVSQSCTYSAWMSRIVAELALLHHLARLPHHRIAGVVVREREDLAGFFDELGELLRLPQRRGQRLVADDVDAALQEGLRDGEVHVVRRDDGDRLDAVLQPRLALRHLLERAVGSGPRAGRARGRRPWRAPGRRRARRRPARTGRRCRAAMRCTAPMKAPWPPPTMPSRMRPTNLSSRPETMSHSL